MLVRYFIEGLLLGLSLGVTCAVTCGPVILPFVLRADRGLRSSLKIFLELFTGRALAYGAVGAAAGALGGMIPQNTRSLISSVAFLVLGLILIYIGIRKEATPAIHFKGFLSKYIARPFVVGVLTGLELCPPFMLAIARAASIGGALGGMMLFMGFLIGTNVFIVPFAFFGVVAGKRGFVIAASIIAIIVGSWFALQGASGLILYSSRGIPESEANFAVIGVPEAPQVLIVSDNSWGDTLFNLIKPATVGTVLVADPANAKEIANKIDTMGIVIWISDSQVPEEIVKRLGVVVARNCKDKKTLLLLNDFVTTYYFKRRFGKGFKLEWKGR